MIPIKNIYYMLSYAFTLLGDGNYKSISTEHFDNIADLMAAILNRGISNLVKRGIGSEYILKDEEISTVKGKIDISSTIKQQSLIKKKVVCNYDDYSINNYKNQIIKSTVNLLLKNDINNDTKKSLRKLMVYFRTVDDIDLNSIDWKFQYNKNNQTYRLLINICYLVKHGLIQSSKKGDSKLMDFIDEKNMHRLYEKFILEYYRKEHPELMVGAPYISWQLDDDFCDYIPSMKSDIVLEKDNKILIIDAKYYSQSFQVNFDRESVHSSNIYQIFTYVKNKAKEVENKNIEVAGMLLYAKTDNQLFDNLKYSMSGNKIYVKTLDLNCEFNKIREQLDDIILCLC